MQPYYTKQAEANLGVGDTVMPKPRPNLLRQWYKQRYTRYEPHMDAYLYARLKITDIRDNDNWYSRLGIVIRTPTFEYIYPYFLLDLIETYDEEYDI